MKYFTARRSVLLAGLALIFFSGCTRKKLTAREQALSPVAAPTLSDDLGSSSFREATDKQLRYWEKNDQAEMVFGNQRIPVPRYADGVKRLAGRLTAGEELVSVLPQEFDFFEVYGADRPGEVLLTSYFEPEIEGSRTRTEPFSYPLYSPPNDLIEVALPKFDDRFFDIGSMRGRLVTEPDTKKTRLYPYYTRREIDADRVLARRGLELCFVDAVDAFFAHIQGSLTVRFPDHTTLALNYADQNGHRYQAIGAYLKDFIPVEQLTAGKLENHLRSLPPADAAALMHRNPSYVFFAKREGGPKGSLGVEVTAGRTLAADGRFFPKGALAYLVFDKPRFDSPTATEPAGWERTGRLLYDQDSGGAIRGGGRIDLYWGSGAEAKRSAGVIRQNARLYYLAPKN